VGGTLFHLGEFSAAQAHLAQSLNLYDAQRHRSHAFLYTTEPGVFGLSYAALVLWHLGYLDQALQKSKAARTLGQELSYPYSLAGPGFCCQVAPAPPGQTPNPRVGRGSNHPRERARISSVGRARDCPAGLGTGRTGTE
jgi:hypothetical protein